METQYPKRLIEVDLPIARISAHARREKSIRHGHISTLHIWWARRPLAACRAVICAALWPDPVDHLCPQKFRDDAVRLITQFAEKVMGGKVEGPSLLDTCSPESLARWEGMVKSGVPLDPTDAAHQNVLRFALLDFIADFANWDNSTHPAYLETSGALTQSAHEALGGEPGTRPLVVDPFAGGGSIPLEALRVGADAFASDLNPVAVLLNKVVLEYIPKYGLRLADEVRKWGESVKKEAEKELAEFYPSGPNGEIPVTYLWARTIRCEGTRCGATVPLIRSLWISKQGRRSIALRLCPNVKNKCVDIEIVRQARLQDVGDGTVKRGSVTCPCCGYTIPVARVRDQLKQDSGGADTSQLLTVVSRGEAGKDYHIPRTVDFDAVKRIQKKVQRDSILSATELPLMSGVFNAPLYGMNRWDLLFSARQLFAAASLGSAIQKVYQKHLTSNPGDFTDAVRLLLLLVRGKYLDFRTTLCGWISVGEKIGHTFGRQALGMIFDWAEGVPFGDISGSWERSVEFVAEFLETEAKAIDHEGTVQRADARFHPLPDDSANAFVTDPPYYNAVPYADLSEFFYLWLQRDLRTDMASLFSEPAVEKSRELCEMKGWDPVRYPEKDAAFYENGMGVALAEGRRVCVPSGIGIVVFAHKTTTGWETLLSALIQAGWIVTASWAIDTERAGRLRAMNSAALASSVHLICRPRENSDGSVRKDDVGEWRDVLGELPKRIHEWMPRLAEEGVVGADAIFACLGPALEVFSRYSRVEKASGEVATLREYLEHVWAAVSTEALSMIFRDADAAGLEPDARITAMWLWTLGGGKKSATEGPESADEETEDSDEETSRSSGASAGKSGYVLEFDAARKIAQGLGIHLEKSESIVEVKGETARLLPVAERTQYLFGKETAAGTTRSGKAKKKIKQKTMFDELGEAEAAEAGWTELKGPPPGTTVLDRLHQAMILFAAGRGELMKRFLLDDGIGADARFWKLAQSLSALYPSGSEEKRWVDGVLARKKGLGL